MRSIYPGTFDPLTIGHEALVRRAARLFEHVVVGVAHSAKKQTMFSLEERVEMATQTFVAQPNVSVVGFSGLLVDFAKAQGAGVLIRGVRSVTDFDYEMQMHGFNRTLNPDLEVVFLAPDAAHGFISSTLVRDVAQHGGDVSAFVSADVLARVRAKVAAQAAPTR